MDEVKVENNISVVCHGCLSSGRTTAALGTLSDVYISIVGNVKQSLVYAVEDIKLCWECRAILKKLQVFQRQLRKAQSVLMQMLYDLDRNVPPLSKLTISRKDLFDHEYQHSDHKKKKPKQATPYLDVQVKIKEYNEDTDNLDIVKEEEDHNEDSIHGYDDKDDIDISDPKTELNDNYNIDNYEELLKNMMNNSYANDNIIESQNETKKVRAKRRKDVKSRENSVSYYKQFTTIIKREKIDWGNIQSYFASTNFGEAEMEEHFLSKERKYSECTRFKYKCVSCERGYLKEFDLKRHNDLNHNKTASFKCSECGDATGSIETLTAHWRDHTPIARCNLCGEVCRPRGMRNHLNYAHTNKYACTLCNMQFGKILHFSAHYKSQHQNYICDYCGASCKSKVLVQKHIRTFHTTFECKECVRQFPNYRRYKRHLSEMHPKWNYGISPLHQLLLALRFYALGTMLLSVADFIGVSKASACRIVQDVSCAMSRLYDKYIYMHTDTELEFYKIARFPRTLGALDGTHIRIQSPGSQTGEEFRNRKGYFSINVQAVCNANLLFMNVVARWPGSAHDATIFNNSELRAQCESRQFGNKWLLGDSAYPLKSYLLTPLSNPQTRGQQLYNEAQIRTRNTIERYGAAPELAYCVECDRQYATVTKYKKHLKVSTKHIQPKRIQLPCPDCGKMFSKKNYLNNHYNLYHAKKSKHYCELCDKYFANGFGLRNHKTHVHMKVSRVKDKMCDLCGRGFATNRILLNHRRTHTGERPYQCPFCSAAFTQKQAMQSHCRTQHKDIK